MTENNASPSSPSPVEKTSEANLISLVDVLKIIRNRWKSGMAVGLLLAGAVGYVKLSEEPMYSAETSLVVEINPEKVVQLQDVTSSTESSGLVDSIMNTYLERLESRSMADFVLQNMDEEDLQLIREAYPDKRVVEYEDGRIVPQVQGSLRGNVTSRWRKGTQIVRIYANHNDPQLAQLYSLKYAEAFIELQSSRIEERTTQTLEFLNKQSLELQNRLEEGERELQQYRSDNDLASLEGNIDMVSARLTQLNNAVTQEKIQLIASENRLEQIEAADGKLDDLMKIAFIADRPRISEISDDLAAAQHERRVLAETYLRRHPLMMENATRIEALQSELEAAVTSGVKEIEEAHEFILAGYGKLKEELSEVEAEALELDRLAIEYRVLQRKLDVQRQIFDVVSEQFTSTDVISQFDMASIRVLDGALLPHRPFSPDPGKVAMICVLLFMGCMIGVPILLEQFDYRLKSFSDIETYIGKPVFGDIRRVRKRAKKDLSRAVLNQDEDLSESFRGIYSALQLQSGFKAPYTFLITSTIPSEGKTVIACNMAAVFAQHHARVLLVDCDFRRPSVHNQLDLENDKGLLQWVHSDAVLGPDDDVATDPRLGIKEIDSHFFVLPSGGATRQSTEVIGHARFKQLIPRLQEKFDIVVIDTVPVGLFPDATLLAKFAQSTLFVARQKAVSKQKAKYAVSRLDKTNAPVCGVVLNYISGYSVVTGYGHHASTYGYGYDSDARKYKKYYAQTK